VLTVPANDEPTDDATTLPTSGGVGGLSADGAVARARDAVAGYEVGRPVVGAPGRRVLLPWSRAWTAKVVTAIRALADGLEALSRTHDAQDDRSAASVEALQRRTDDVVDQIGRVERERRADAQELRRLRGLIHPDGGGPEAALEAVEPEDAQPLSPAAYLEFERRFRGAREEIQQRQWDAVRFVEGLIGGSAPLLDLGAGRGEWLGVLQQAGIPAYGVDTNPEMAGAAVDAGLDVRAGDALAHLDGLPEGSLGAVSAFHLVEHVPIPVLRKLLDAAYLALRPGGILLLETPNPTNLVVGAASFYLDPTHLRPLHPQFLHFLVEMHGFVDVQVHFVHPVDGELATMTAGLDGSRDARVLDAAAYALFGAQDYVVMARRPAAG